MSITLSVTIERFPLKVPFVISRGAKTDAVVVAVTLSDGTSTGRGECTPYARYGETPESVVAAIEDTAGTPGVLGSREALNAALPAGAARNALDCALWDLEAKRSGKPVHMLAGLPAPTARVTCYTISLDTPDAMQAAAERVAARKLLKVKLGRDGDPQRIAAVRRGAPNAELVVDANEGWSAETLAANVAACADAGVTLIEQPLPADRDGALRGFRSPVLLCADESVHARPSLHGLRDKYGAVNIKLDKTGGLTEALAMAHDARQAGLRIMAGCMVGTSLAMAPAMLIAQQADVVDLDGPLLLARDREHGLVYRDSMVGAPVPTLWG